MKTWWSWKSAGIGAAAAVVVLVIPVVVYATVQTSQAQYAACMAQQGYALPLDANTDLDGAIAAASNC
jgi:hypothetical protein